MCLDIKSKLCQILTIEHLPGCDSIIIKFEISESIYSKPLFYLLPLPFIMCNFSPINKKELKLTGSKKGINLDDTPSAGIADEQNKRRLYYGYLELINNERSINKKLTIDNIKIGDVYCSIKSVDTVLNFMEENSLLPIYAPGILAARYSEQDYMENVIDLIIENCKDDVIDLSTQTLGYRDNIFIDSRAVSDSLLSLISFGKAISIMTNQNINFTGILNYENYITMQQEYKIANIKISNNKQACKILINLENFENKFLTEMIYYGKIKTHKLIEELPDADEVGRKLHELVKPKFINHI